MALNAPELDPLIRQPTRLRIMSALVSLDEGEQLDFMDLLALMEMTPGNMGAHLQKLEKAGYVGIDKTFVERRPKTWLAATAQGRRAFAAHVDALEAIARQGEKEQGDSTNEENNDA